MDKTRQPPLPMALASPAGLIAAHLTPAEVQLLDSFRSMDAGGQEDCILAARGLARVWPRERCTPALKILAGGLAPGAPSATAKGGSHA